MMKMLSRCLHQRGASSLLHLRSTPPSAAKALRAFSTSALPHDNHNHDHETEKMMSEGGGSTASFHEKKDELKSKKIGVSDSNQPSKDEWQETKDSVADVANRASDKGKYAFESAGEKSGQTAQSVMGKVSEQAKKEMNTSADMMKDIPQKVAETTQGLKEVGVEAAKAVKRDASRVAEKVGLKNP